MPSSSVSQRLALIGATLIAVLMLIAVIYVQLPVAEETGISIGIVDIVGAAFAVLAFGLFAYAAFWSFNVRRALSVPIYRTQAFGIGLIAFNEAFVDPLNHLLVGIFTDSYAPIFFLVDAFLLLVWLYWIDASLLAGRRSDPLLRDTLHWRRTRKMVWPIMLVLSAILVAIAFYYFLATGSEPQFVTSTSLSQLDMSLFYNSYLWAFAAFTAAALILTGMRSGDKQLHRQLEWFGAFELISILVSAAGQTTLFGASGSGTSTFLLGASLLVQAFFIYKAARSLAPTSRIEKLESAPAAS